MEKSVGASPQGDSKFTSARNTITRPFRATWVMATGLLGETFRTARSNPMTWTAILAVAGAACFAARSAHLGTVVLGSIGVLWMWQDMIGEAAAAAQKQGIAASPDGAPLLTLHQ